MIGYISANILHVYKHVSSAAFQHVLKMLNCAKFGKMFRNICILHFITALAKQTDV